MEGLMLKLKLQYFGHPMWRADSLEKILMLGKIEGRRRRDNRGWGGWMASPTEWTWVWVNSGSWWWTGSLVCCSPWGHKELETTEQMNWTELYSPWNSPGQNTRVGSRSHLQGIFPTQGLNPGLPHCRLGILYCLSHQSFPPSGSFPMSQFFTSGGQSIGVSASTSVLPMNIQYWFPLGWTG